ncbi:hypothetical protein SDC9_191345 [bioreactor metagenome]|uniref:Uncharacterized protein n=1 Tax=bioreactor metagenome TaxID=1076179 RepID=A0A645HXM4_9ZZZZ
MIKNFDTKQISSLFESVSYILILSTWFKIATRMVMGDNDSRCIIQQNWTKNFSRMNQCPVDQTLGYGMNIDNLMCSIQRYPKEIFIVEQGFNRD